jgi:hypothetical protein
VDISCIISSQYGTLRPVLEQFEACKLLKVKELKQHFKFSKVFHNPVEKPVENFLLIFI